MKSYIPINDDIKRKSDLNDFLNNLDNDMNSRN